MKMIWCGLKNKENDHLLVNQFHGNFREIKSVFRDVKWCFNASWGFKGLSWFKHNDEWKKIASLCCKQNSLDVTLQQARDIDTMSTKSMKSRVDQISLDPKSEHWAVAILYHRSWHKGSEPWIERHLWYREWRREIEGSQHTQNICITFIQRFRRWPNIL